MLFASKNTNIETDFIKKFEQEIENKPIEYSITQGTEIDVKSIENTVEKIAAKMSIIEGIPTNLAMIGICALLQCGSYLKSVSNRSIKIGNIDFTKRKLLFAAEQVENKYTLRNIAKAINKTIAKTAYKYNIPGHLYSRFKIENANLIAQNDPETNKRISIYCTDFQIENPDTPPIVREYLATREKRRNTKPETNK